MTDKDREDSESAAGRGAPSARVISVRAPAVAICLSVIGLNSTPSNL